VPARDLALLGHADAEQGVALPSAAGHDPEIGRRELGALGIGERRQLGLDLRRGGQTS